MLPTPEIDKFNWSKYAYYFDLRLTDAIVLISDFLFDAKYVERT